MRAFAAIAQRRWGAPELHDEGCVMMRQGIQMQDTGSPLC